MANHQYPKIISQRNAFAYEMFMILSDHVTFLFKFKKQFDKIDYIIIIVIAPFFEYLMGLYNILLSIFDSIFFNTFFLPWISFLRGPKAKFCNVLLEAVTKHMIVNFLIITWSFHWWYMLYFLRWFFVLRYVSYRLSLFMQYSLFLFTKILFRFSWYKF